MTKNFRRLGRLFCCLLTLGVLAFAADPNKTLISDTIYRADGTAASGTLMISWPAFVTADGKPVAAGTKSVKIGAAGAVSISLVPNQGATPAGTYYKVVLSLDDGTSSQEYWSVPTLSPTTIAAIRSSVVPASVAMQVVSREYVDSAVGNAVRKNGDETISGIKTFESSPLVPSPSSPSAAANKDYVDAVAAGAGGSVLALNRGGTGQNVWTAGRCVRVNDSGTKLESAGADCGSGGGGNATQIQGKAVDTPDTAGTVAHYDGTKIDWLALPINTTNGTVPVRQGASTFVDSPVRIVGTQTFIGATPLDIWGTYWTAASTTPNFTVFGSALQSIGIAGYGYNDDTNTPSIALGVMGVGDANQTGGSASGVRAWASGSGSVALQDLYALEAMVEYDGSGSVVNMDGVNVSFLSNDSAVPVTAAHGVRVRSLADALATSIYAYHDDDQGNAANVWGYYQEGDTTPSRLPVLNTHRIVGEAVAADPTCSGSDYWIAPVAGSTNKWRVCDHGTLRDLAMASALSAQYTDWNSSSGGDSIKNKPTLGTAASHAATDFLASTVQLAQTKSCTGTDKVSAYDASTGLFTCSADQTTSGGSGITSLNGATVGTQTFVNGANISVSTNTSTGAHTIAVTGLAGVALSGAYSDLTGKPSLAAVATSGAYTDLSGRPTLGTAAALDVPASGNASTAQVVKGNDSRLSDARTPTAHTHAESDVTNLTTDLAGKVATTRTVNGHALSADVTVTKSDVGLGNADNTSDANKPVSTAQQTALDGKVDKGTATWPSSGTVATTSSTVAAANALAADPSDCSAGQYAQSIAANGNLTCKAVAYSEVSGTPSLGGAAALNVGTTAGTVAAGDHGHTLAGDVTGAVGSTALRTGLNVRTCEIHIWGSGANSILQDTDDEVASCLNKYGATWTITYVGCWANAGSPSVMITKTGGNNVLSGSLTCGTASWASGTLTGTTADKQTADGGTVDVNIVAAGGTATNIRVVIAGTI